MNYVDKTFLYYLGQINKVSLLTREEEFDLAKRAQAGERLAKQKLVAANLRFVVQMAKRYANSNLGMMDLVSEGNLGLLRAVETFDPDKGFHFISYAVHWIKQSIIKAISEKSKIVRIPLNLNNSLTHIERALREKHHGELSDRSIEDVAKDVQMNKKDMLAIIEVTRPHASLDRVMEDDSGSGRSLGDMIQDENKSGPEQMVLDISLRENIFEALKTLSATEAEIIKMRFGLEGKAPMTLLEIGKIKKLTKERIRQIEKKALESLKSPQNSKHLSDYVVV
jgi:RNA polymerase primary sigma factor